MRNDTRQAFNAYLEQVASLNNVQDTSAKFAVVPEVEQTLESHIQHSSAFLQQVNSIGVDQQTGEKVGLLISSSIASRTNTALADRQTQDPSDEDARQYACKQTNFDTHLTYQRMDAWAKFPDFQTRIRDMILRQQALDRITIGFNGTSAAAQTDRVANPLLQDVNIGWMKKLQTEAPARYMTQGATANEVRVGVGAGADYKNLDALIYDMRSSLLGAWHARNNTFTAICSPDLVDEKYFPLIQANGDKPLEMGALDLQISNKRLGGLAVAEVPFFPTRSVMITLLNPGGYSNLSVYYQNNTRRRFILDNAKRDRVENYESINEAYVIEDLTACGVCVNIKLWDGVAWV